MIPEAISSQHRAGRSVETSLAGAAGVELARQEPRGYVSAT